MKIFKYKLFDAPGRVTHALPERGTLLHVGLDPHGELCMWALVDPTNIDCPWTIHITGTGLETDLPANWHVASVTVGRFVWHVFLEPHV